MVEVEQSGGTFINKSLLNPVHSLLPRREHYALQGDYVGFNTGSGERLSYSQAGPGQLLGCSLVSIHFRGLILHIHPALQRPTNRLWPCRGSRAAGGAAIERL